MASIWMLLDGVPVDDFVPSIVVPLLKTLGDHGIHANLEPTTNHTFQSEGTLAYALFPGGELVFIFTTGPTHNPISGTVDSSRYMMADIKGIPSGLGITEDDVSDAIRQFHQGLVEREIYGGRPRITEGNSLGGTLTTESYPNTPSEPRFRAAQPVATESDSPQESVWPGQAPHSASEAGMSTVENKRGCYIATAVYGDYDHPQVRTLRRFRDETLRASWAGRLVIDVYYKVSPVMIRRFGDRVWFKSITRPFLDALVAKLSAGDTSDVDYTDPE